MEIIPKLTLLQNPRVVENGSIVQAENIIFDSNNTLKVDEIYNNINLNDKIKESTNNKDYNIIEILNTNNDLILFIVSNKQLYILKADIDETTKEINKFIKIINYDIEYCEDVNEFKLNCTYIYNKNNDLIISYNELYPNIQIPLKILNVSEGNIIKDNINIYSDTSFELINGIFYVGSYDIFIRKKIDKYNYTNWLNIKTNFILDDAEIINKIDYTNPNKTDEHFNIKDYVTSENICNKTIKCKINTDNKIYQLCFVRKLNDVTEAFKSDDIKSISNNGSYYIEFELNKQFVSSYTLTELFNNTNTLYNVKTLTSYNNSLYIGNYEEYSFPENINNSELKIAGTYEEYNYRYDKYKIEIKNKDNDVFTITSDYRNSLSLFDLKDVLGVSINENTIILVKNTKNNLYKTKAKYLYFDYSDGGTFITNTSGVDIGEIYKEIRIGKASNTNLVDDNYQNNIYKILNDCTITTNGGTVTRTTIQNNIINENINKHSLIPFKKYKFYIHFINDNMDVSNGYLISRKDNIKPDDNLLNYEKNITFTDNGDNNIFEVGAGTYNNKKYNRYNLKLLNIEKPAGNINHCFFSYKECNDVIFLGYCIPDNYKIKIYNDNINIKPQRLNIDKLIIYNTFYTDIINNIKNEENSDNSNNILNIGAQQNSYDNIDKQYIKNINIVVANDPYKNNQGNVSYYEIEIDNNINIGKTKPIYNKHYGLCYAVIEKNTDELIKCSNIININNFNNYTDEYGNKINFYISDILDNINLLSIIRFDNAGIYFDENKKIYESYNDGEDEKFLIARQYNTMVYQNKYLFLRYFFNEPIINFYSSGEISKFNIILEPKNTIDLYKNKYLDLKELIIYEELKKEQNTNKFYNTIRKSYPILDESNEINWIKFNINTYKNIINNKGHVIKLVNSGNILLIHTDKTLFLLDGSDTIKTTNEGNIQLSSIDVWDVNFKELIPSENSYAGLKDKNKSILGEFGYIWYNEDKLLRLDNNNQLSIISDDIYNFLKQYNYKINSIYDDWYNTRLLIQCVKEDKNNIIISYNYRTNSFISTHKFNTYNNIITNLFRFKDINYIIGYDDNNLNNDNIYILNDNKDNKINGFIDIIFNDKYDVIKYLEYIKYKLTIKDIDFDNSDNILLQNKKIAYPGNKIRIYSEYCDTGDIDIIGKDEIIDSFNNIDSKLPYWDLGTLNFNNIRNKIKDSDLYTDLNDNEQSLIFGNYFVVRIIFDTKNRIGIDSIEFYTKQKI